MYNIMWYASQQSRCLEKYHINQVQQVYILWNIVYIQHNNRRTWCTYNIVYILIELCNMSKYCINRYGKPWRIIRSLKYQDNINIYSSQGTRVLITIPPVPSYMNPKCISECGAPWLLTLQRHTPVVHLTIKPEGEHTGQIRLGSWHCSAGIWGYNAIIRLELLQLMLCDYN